MALLTVSQMKNRSKGMVKIGDTLFIDGSPHKVCGNCDKILVDKDINYQIKDTPTGRQIKIGRKGNVTKSEHKSTGDIRYYKISIGNKRPYDQYDIAHQDPNPHRIVTVETKYHHNLRQVDGCFDCWNLQQQEKIQNPGKVVFFWK